MEYTPLLAGRRETQLFRAMFLIPFQIPVAAGIFSLGQNLNNSLGAVPDCYGRHHNISICTISGDS
jgi:hypothetical protein